VHGSKEIKECFSVIVGYVNDRIHSQGLSCYCGCCHIKRGPNNNKPATLYTNALLAEYSKLAQIYLQHKRLATREFYKRMPSMGLLLRVNIIQFKYWLLSRGKFYCYVRNHSLHPSSTYCKLVIRFNSLVN
jgi:hypothetical protein